MSDNNSEAGEKTTTTVLAGNPTEGVVLKRKPKKYLDARWLCETAKLAQKYNTKIIFFHRNSICSSINIPEN